MARGFFIIKMKRICEFCKKEYNWEEEQSNWVKPNSNMQPSDINAISSKRFCCYECGIQARVNKRKQTWINKYGTTKLGTIKSIAEKKKATFLKNYGVESNFQAKECILKIKQTRENNIKNIPDYKENIQEKRKKTCLKKYNVENINQIPEVREKIKNTNLKRYGNKNGIDFSKINHKERFKKELETKKKNNTFCSSNQEDLVYLLLLQKFSNVKRQYSSEKYPFACDFYIPELDLYIEYQGMWTHGNKPYNPKDEDCINLINKWQRKLTKFYKIALHVYTESDPLKRQTAKENNLNWLEFFNLTDLKEWLKI